MNYGWLEQRCLELEHAGNFDLTYAPVAYRTGGRRHRLRFLLSPGLAGSPEWIIRHGLTRGHVNGVFCKTIARWHFDLSRAPGKDCRAEG